MNKIKLLENSGIKFIGNTETLKKDNKTLVVLGVARGGTSLVSGALSKLGLFGGEESTAPVFEDTKLAGAYENKDYKLAKRIINEYNSIHKIWSFKRPSSIDYLDSIHKDLANPIYIIIFKDIFSIANRNNISMKMNILQGLNRAMHDYRKILNFLDDNSVSGLLLSYEKIMQNKEDFIDNLKLIVGEDKVSDSQYKEALKFIEPNPKSYLDATRITKATGVIDKVTLKSISGWVKYVHTDKSPVVEVFVNGEVRTTSLADNFRADLKEKNIHKTGFCGFNINIKLNKGDRVSVKVIDDVDYLKNSNWIIT
jgi:hypothetical protein